MEHERYVRHRHAYELMRLCASLWSFLVFMYFVNMWVHLALPVGHPFRLNYSAMYVDTFFDAIAKTGSVS